MMRGSNMTVSNAGSLQSGRLKSVRAGALGLAIGRVATFSGAHAAQAPVQTSLLPLLQAGAAGYLTKGAGLGEMVQAIRLVFAGQRYISPQIAQQLALKSFEPQNASPFDSLSEREIQIALMIVGCQKVQIISDKLCLSPKTVNTYRYRIFEKLSISSDVELTLLAVRHGMVDASL